MISLIVAMDLDRLIGVGGQMPWHLPDDTGWFRRQTMGKPVIMGRKTYASIPARFRPLAGRANIILTRDHAFAAPECAIAHTVAAAVEAIATVPEAMVIGGGTVYEQFLPLADRLYVTLINGRFSPTSSPTYFPAYDAHNWQESHRQTHEQDSRHAHAFTWIVLERKI